MAGLASAGRWLNFRNGGRVRIAWHTRDCALPFGRFVAVERGKLRRTARSRNTTIKGLRGVIVRWSGDNWFIQEVGPVGNASLWVGLFISPCLAGHRLEGPGL